MNIGSIGQKGNVVVVDVGRNSAVDGNTNGISCFTTGKCIDPVVELREELLSEELWDVEFDEESSIKSSLILPKLGFFM